ncbi:MAG: MFS transporter [Rhodospirillaceae bacterium]|nr:MFS transporter [Rhodospirillaceae bacterium]
MNRDLTPSTRLKSIVGGSIGNLVEWFDWYVYSALALYFAPAFFPTAHPTTQLLNTAAIFAVGFLARPAGSWLMGLYADRHGRKAALTISVAFMCLGSLIIALTPAYDDIGVAAPVILLLARLLQGLSVGGEYGTSATYLSEMAEEKHRGFYSSFQYVTLIMGQLLALALLILLQATLTEEQLHAWGWRIPFLVGAGGAVVAFYLRRGITETGAFKAAAVRSDRGTLAALLQHRRAVLTVVGLTLGGTVAFYTYTTYMQKFMVNTAGFSKDTATLVSTAALFVFMLLQPVMGALSDRIGRRPLLIAFGVFGVVATVPLMTALGETRDTWTAFILMMAGLVIVSGYTSINAVVKAELFPAHVRALGVGFPYAFTVALFGGSAEYVALWLKEAGVESLFYWYVTGCIAISLGIYAVMPETKKRSQIESDPL